jgi:precorrin-2 dehydrogenase/sirohydrochlorin ferrochelatase
MRSSVHAAYPLMLDVSTRLVVIVGGGGVAARKALGLLDAGATRVRVISPTFCETMPSGVERVGRAYESGDLDGAVLAFAATDRPEVNQAVVREANRLGVLVNRADADDDSPADFSTPATLREGALTLTVSAGGSPALAAVVRDGLRARLDPRWAAMAAAMRELRPRILDAGAPIERRRAAFRDLASDEAMDVLRDRGMDELWSWLRRRHNEIGLGRISE